MHLDDITLIVPTKDEAGNILPFIESLPADLSLIVVDASQDETADLVWAHRPENSLVICQPGSVTEAR